MAKLFDFIKSKLPKTKKQILAEQRKELEQSVCADINSSSKIEFGEDGQETPESFVARMDASQAMMEKMLKLAKLPNSGITVMQGGFGDDEFDSAYDEFLREKYKQDQKTIKLKKLKQEQEQEQNQIMPDKE